MKNKSLLEPIIDLIWEDEDVITPNSDIIVDCIAPACTNSPGRLPPSFGVVCGFTFGLDCL